MTTVVSNCVNFTQGSPNIVTITASDYTTNPSVFTNKPILPVTISTPQIPGIDTNFNIKVSISTLTYTLDINNNVGTFTNKNEGITITFPLTKLDKHQLECQGTNPKKNI